MRIDLRALAVVSSTPKGFRSPPFFGSWPGFFFREDLLAPLYLSPVVPPSDAGEVSLLKSRFNFFVA